MANHLFQTKERTFADSGFSTALFIKADTEAGLPTTGISEGDLAYTLDSDKVFKRTGSAWVEIVSVGGTGSDTWRDPVAFRASGSNAADDEFRDSSVSGWTQVDRATNAVTWTEQGDAISVAVPGALASEITELHALLKVVSGIGIGTTITTAMRCIANPGSVCQAGLIFSNGHAYGAGTQVMFMLQGQNSGTVQTTQSRFTNFNTFGAGGNSTAFAWKGPYVWLRMTWQASNTFRYQWSCDGITWITSIADQSHTITPTEAGLVITSGNNTPAMASFEFFRVT